MTKNNETVMGAFEYNGKDERFAVVGGIAVPIPPNGITGAGMVLPHSGEHVVTIPADKKEWFRKPRDRRIVLYPPHAAVPLPLASPHKVKPDELRREDILNLYGPYPPQLVRRAMGSLLAEFEKIRLKDWILIGIGSFTLAGAWAAAYYAYKLWKLMS